MSKLNLTVGKYGAIEWCMKCIRYHEVWCAIVHDKYEDKTYEAKISLYKLTQNLIRLKVVKCRSLRPD
jgi:hypothetical protein